MLNAKEHSAVQEFKARIVEGLSDKILSIKLFGSKARGDETPESDIDLFVLVSERDMQVEDIIWDAAYEVNLKYDVFISTRIVPLAVLKDPVWSSTPFIRNVEKEGVPV